MNFDVEKMHLYCEAAVAEFARDHPDEVFYAFAIDSDLLCLNSEEKFVESLSKYQSNWSKHYSNQNDIHELRYNTGDWTYQGFAELNADCGFVSDLYAEHYDIAMNSEESTASTTKYARAMNELVEKLKRTKTFDTLKTTPDFQVLWVDHNY